MKTTYGILTANASVDELILTEDKAYVRQNIQAINKPGTADNPGFKGFSYDEIEYDKDEYIIKMSNELKDTNALVNVIMGGRV